MKQYNGEKAIISLTSWKKRINTVSKTLFSLFKQCKDFHVVLVLSEDEFPKKEQELPEILQTFLENNLFELLWVKPNLKAFKKILFTMDKYRNVPIISADDDCMYKYNYAEELYQHWLKNKNNVVSYRNDNYSGIGCTWGCATLYPPYYFKDKGLKYLSSKIVEVGLDDNYYVILRKRMGIHGTTYVNKSIESAVIFRNEIEPLHNTYRRNAAHNKAYGIIDKLINIA